MTTTESGAAVVAPPSLSPRRRTLVLASMCLALVLVVAGVTMLVNALPLIAEELNLSQSKQTWVVDAYALPFAALLMIAGALGDRYGRRGALLAGTALFGIGSILSAMADSGNALLAYRAVMGLARPSSCRAPCPPSRASSPRRSGPAPSASGSVSP
jgi:MFS family permease